jgi:predicted GNAT superfamily acetyltransferase
VKARNGYFNLEKLGAIVTEYERNFYGIDYAAADGKQIGLQSDRLFAEWHLESEKVRALAAGEAWTESRTPEAEVEVRNDWAELVANDPAAALELQLRVRADFEAAIARGLHAAAFRRDPVTPAYLMFSR